MKKAKKFTFVTLIIILVFTLAAGCADREKDALPDGAPPFVSYRDIPGVTESEITEIERIKQTRGSFVYGMEGSTECFIDDNGGFGGFAALFTDWLGELFGIPFDIVLYEWDELITGLSTSEIDFTGDLTPTRQRRDVYHMTNPIAMRPIKLMWLQDRAYPPEIYNHRTPRYVYTDQAAAYGQTVPLLQEPYEIIFANNNTEVYEMLKSGEADAFVEEAPYEAWFDAYDDIVTEQFFPLVNSPVSLTTQNDELAPFISVMQKALNGGANKYLTDLYNIGYMQYLGHKLTTNLTDAEKAYINAHKQNGTPVPIGIEYDNYPISFYNKNEQQWQGIAMDVLDRISELTGLDFEIKNDVDTGFSELINMLERGEIALIGEVIPTKEREGRFIWPKAYSSDKHALISLMDFPDIEINDVLYLRVGLQRNVAYTDIFWQWFPDHQNTVYYDDAISAINGLENDEIDVYMGTRGMLLQATNFLERPGFKANIVFNRYYESAFGISPDEPELCSVIDKSLRMIDTNMLAERWMVRVFDYESAAARQRTPYLIALSALFFFTAAMFVIMFIRGKQQNTRLENAVDLRTRELAEQMNLAVSASKAKSDFLAQMSHEIRTPLNAIIGIAQIELQQADKTDEKHIAAFRKIMNSGGVLLGIINDILDMSKIETGKLEINPEEYSVPELINDVIQLNKVRIGQKPIEFILDISENAPLKLRGDALRIKQILNNLLSNAIKYTQTGHVRLKLRSNRDFDRVLLNFIVKDTGQGIKKEDMPKLFTEYSRLNKDANTFIEGTGLGLTITKRLTEMMGGEIKASSEYGVGSRFAVIIVQEAVSDEVIGKQTAESLMNFTYNSDTDIYPAIEYKPMPHGRALIVDDLEINLFVAEGMLAPYELNIDSASSGYEVIEKIENGNVYDIIFMDHMMPHMDGVETTKKLRESGYTGVIVALTANAIAGSDTMFKENGFDDFLAKPMDPDKLNEILMKYIAAY